MIEKIKKTREYLDYLEEHYNNVQKAWAELQEKCKDMRFIWDDYFYSEIDSEVINHDESKMSPEEFQKYRQFFYPCVGEIKNKGLFLEAWEHHKKENLHHWESWTNRDLQYQFWEMAIVHNIIDWMAMGYKFGDTAQSFYEKQKSEGKIKIPENAEDFIYEIFKRVYLK